MTMSTNTTINDDIVAVQVNQGDLDQVSNATFYNPHAILGAHLAEGEQAQYTTVRVLRPFAKTVTIVTQAGEYEARHEFNGVFVAIVPSVVNDDGGYSVPDYRVKVSYEDVPETIQDDPYRYLPTVGEMDMYLFGEGRHERLWDALGAHVREYDDPMGGVDGTPGEKVTGVSFAVWAPNAHAVRVIGSFNGWDGRCHAMRELGSSGVWELFIPGVKAGDVYKYQILNANWEWVDKADPMERSHEIPPATGSVVVDSKHEWHDEEWMERRAATDPHNGPVTIYELNALSWRKDVNNYRELADKLVPYVQKMGFTHVEFMPLAEYPFTGSWGYQVTGYYAIDSRLGGPDDFKYLVEKLHEAGIGVIMDWVPAHFPKDAFALGRFDGTPLYEDPDPTRGEHPDWGTYIFNFGRNEVRNFLVADACFWLNEYHMDGLRVDAVSSMLYLDYSREPGQWHPNIYGGRENLEAIDFLKEANATAYKNNPGIMMIAEESTAYPGITAPTDAGGVGFGLKWNMGWMHDTLQYLHESPINRKWHHDEITFSMVYAYSERYVLPISHDEVVYGKGSLFGKMPGDNWQKYAGVRALFAYQWAHPGKKLTFMGNELAQWGEWDHDNSIDWDCLNWQEHASVQRLVADLNKLYKQTPAIWSQDFTPDGFQWLTSDDADHNTLSFVRIGTKGEECVVVVNFSGEAWSDYQVALPHGGRWTEVLSTDSTVYGGSGISNGTFEADAGEYHSRPASARITVPALAAVFLKPEN
ncbi:1,4-alpha-glucan branching enzyme [Bifidobacterium angulatum DSM 20098 = JCM 7096]|jgi:1,4-alpha-glucan branching enzyme|uniref:1,4-alpha-glucan branching enzyme GlgB n=2 Tax=Bifidobacterium angulatum TaxID=1683 RepID=C4FFN1_9BIFI|nr:1,4-alpha-glucan branching enzyme [Bifidobacterium angulatum DSM 20098 = JCM 7096]KFI41076.1 1,4-alpha-glucan branching enzyme [Bifidobacterium angulatum]BAQ96640.1 glycosyl hydrolase [Bifidobacterium angulatum DSM 20098 = JCM 7096]